MQARIALRSPWTSLGLATVLVALVALALVSGLVGGPGPSPSSAAVASPTAPASQLPSLQPTFGYPTPSPEPTFTAYTVRVGDSLTSIAAAFRTTPRSIAWWNRGTYPSLDPESPSYRPNDIKPGWILVLIPGGVVDDQNPPSPSPPPATPTPGPTVTPTASPTPTSKPSIAPSVAPTPAPASIITHGSRTSGRIALTFDMGGRVIPALDIVNWLVAHRVHATFFPTGEMTANATGRAVLALVKAHPELFDLGNHSWDHSDFTTLTAAQMASQLKRSEAALAPLAGQTTKPWFRPPDGAVNTKVQAGVGAAGWRYIVKWDVDTIDWATPSDTRYQTAAMITAKVSSRAQAGSIVLMHLGGYNTFDALPGILAAVQAKGLQPVTLGELLGR